MNETEEITNNDVPRDSLPKFNVCICLPNMGHIHMALVVYLLKWLREFPPNTIDFFFSYRVAYIDRARNQDVEYVLESKKKYTHLLFIDSDTIPPRDGLLKLLHADKDIVTGMTPMLQYDRENDHFARMYNCFIREYKEDGTLDRTITPTEDTGIIEIERCGSSFILIKRNVLESMEKPLYKFEFNDAHTQHTRSEDIYFCDNAREAGYKIWCDTSVICKHYKEIMM
ncbi:hypothetical protein UFOVP594_37 [uncultured Caudovirales phage]|uniref:Anp1 n=1 Tax=uncultured Caudovirales phage TaxID=2100421 RepID=A0A6J5MZ87_9CAUD|nr:hypothetical protein UFOVP594_37 [uncultured Caudovirales phage]